MNGRASVVVVEDDEPFRRTLVAAIGLAGFAVVAEADDIASALAAIQHEQPHAVVCDLRLPPDHAFEGVALARAVRVNVPQRPGVLVMSHDSEAEIVREVLDTASEGVGYTLKASLARRASLVDLLERTVRRETVVDGVVAAELVAAWQTGPLAHSARAISHPVLTAIAEGRDDATIAARSGAGPREIAKTLRILGVDEATDVHRRTRALFAALRFAD